MASRKVQRPVGAMPRLSADEQKEEELGNELAHVLRLALNAWYEDSPQLKRLGRDRTRRIVRGAIGALLDAQPKPGEEG